MSKRIGRKCIGALLASVLVFVTVPVSANAAEAVGAAGEVLEEVSDESRTDTDEDSEEMTGTEDVDDSTVTEEEPEEAIEKVEKASVVRAAGTETIAQLKQRFPAGKYWNCVNLGYNNPDGVTSTPCPNNHDTAPNTCNNYRGYAQCWGFAYRLAYGYYGSCPLDGWSQSNDKNSLDSLKAGDIIRFNSHVVWVTGVDGDTITIADCNYDYHCGIRWDVPMSKSYIKNSTSFNSKWSAPYAAMDSPFDRIKGAYMDTGYSRVIPDGYYHIASSFGDQWWLTIADMSNDNKANVHLWDYSIRDYEFDEQLFYFEFIDEGGRGFYKITNKQSGKCLDVEDASEYMYDESGNPTNVWQYEYNGSSAQQWAIREVDGGDKGILYTFQARCSGFCLDLFYGESSLYNGANISLHTDNGTPAQQWRLVPYAPAVGQTIEDGEYQIVYSTAENKAIGTEMNGNGANIELSTSYKGDYRQTFDVKYLGNGYYSIINKHSGLSLDVANYSRMLGTHIQLCRYAENDAQKWIIQPDGNGSYNIISKCNGLYLHLDGAGAEDGENINMWGWETDNTIKWKFVPYIQPKLPTPTSTLSNAEEVDAGTEFYLDKNGADALYFTWDGTTPTKQSTKYSDSTGLTIPTGQTTCTLKAFGVKEGYQDSDILEITYTVKQKEPSGEEGGDTNPEDDDLQDGVKWHYIEQKITYKDLSQYGQIVTTIKPKTYDGTPYKPAVKVTVNENGKTITLTEGTDYRVLYFDNTHAGTGTVTVKGNGVYKGTISKKFEIKKKSCKKLKVVTNSMLTGDSRTPGIYVYDGNVLLKENEDYVLDGITPNLTATKGTKQISVIAVQNSDYEGMISAKIKVYDADKGRIKGIIDSPKNVKLSQSTYQYTGKACKPTAVVTVDGNILTSGKDYTIKYQNNKDSGTAFATITGKGSYVGSVVKEFTIKPSNGEFTLNKPIAAVTYNGKLQKPKITVKVDGKTLKQNKDYTLSYSNNLHATDSAKVTVCGKGNYADAVTKVFYFTIKPCHIKKVSVKGGQGSLLITHAKHTLVEGVDYDVIYGDAAGKGKILVTIKAKEGSSFTGEISKKVKQQR